jgi:hypothetical protein
MATVQKTSPSKINPIGLKRIAFDEALACRSPSLDAVPPLNGCPMNDWVIAPRFDQAWDFAANGLARVWVCSRGSKETRAACR